jgi:hypothetical protein
LAILVILLLGVLWAAVLVPPILRSRSQSSLGGVGDFMARLGAIGRHESRRSTPKGMLGVSGGLLGPKPIEPIAPPVRHMRIPGAMTPAQKRRRDVLVVLLAGVGFTFLLAVVGHSMALWFLQLLADALLGAYVFLLLQFKARAQERRTKISYIDRPRPVMAPVRADMTDPSSALVLRRSASY